MGMRSASAGGESEAGEQRVRVDLDDRAAVLAETSVR